MAYEFNGTTQRLTASPPVTGIPLTISIWFNKNTTTTKNILVFEGQTISAGLYNNGSSLRHYTQGGGVADFSLGTFSASTWNHAAYVATSSTSRFGALNGTISATNTTSVVISNLFTTLAIGANFVGGFPFDGLLAEVGIWNTDLTTAEIVSLSKGMTCDKVRPQSLVFYAPLVRNLQDVRGGLTITNNNTATVATHPRVYA
jgi:hypothetical protein